MFQWLFLERKFISSLYLVCANPIYFECWLLNRIVGLGFDIKSYCRRLKNFMSLYFKGRWFQGMLWYQRPLQSPTANWFGLLSLEKFQYKPQKNPVTKFRSETWKKHEWICGTYSAVKQWKYEPAWCFLYLAVSLCFVAVGKSVGEFRIHVGFAWVLSLGCE